MFPAEHSKFMHSANLTQERFKQSPLIQNEDDLVHVYRVSNRFFFRGSLKPLFSFQGVTEIFQCIYCSSLPNLFLFSLRQKNAGLWLSVCQGIILCVSYAHLCIIASAGISKPVTWIQITLVRKHEFN